MVSQLQEGTLFQVQYGRASVPSARITCTDGANGGRGGGGGGAGKQLATKSVLALDTAACWNSVGGGSTTAYQKLPDAAVLVHISLPETNVPAAS